MKIVFIILSVLFNFIWLGYTASHTASENWLVIIPEIFFFFLFVFCLAVVAILSRLDSNHKQLMKKMDQFLGDSSRSGTETK